VIILPVCFDFQPYFQPAASKTPENKKCPDHPEPLVAPAPEIGPAEHYDDISQATRQQVENHRPSRFGGWSFGVPAIGRAVRDPFRHILCNEAVLAVVVDRHLSEIVRDGLNVGTYVIPDACRRSLNRGNSDDSLSKIRIKITLHLGAPSEPANLIALSGLLNDLLVDYLVWLLGCKYDGLIALT
jgi:hypothetical protein